MRSLRWGAAAALAIVLASAGPAPGAGLSGPRLREVRELSAGTAILQFDAKRTSRRALGSRLRALGLEPRFMHRLRMASVTGGATVLRRAARLRGVTAIHMNARLGFHLDQSVPVAYGGAAKRDAARAAGFDGSGVVVAVVDSGIDGTHPDLADRVLKNFKMTEAGPVECPAYPCTTDTTSGHGTHVASTIAGSGSASGGDYVGVAPGAKLVGYGTGEAIAVLYALEAFDHILAHPELGISVVNNSWGPTADDKRYDGRDPINVATKALTDAGVVVVFSAGNSDTGPRRDEGVQGGSDCETVKAADGTRETSGTECAINTYSVAPWAISVAAERKDYGGLPGEQPLAYFSSRGDPFPQIGLDGTSVTYEPTLSAPGVNVWAAKTTTGATNYTCGASAEPPSCTYKPQHALQYASMSGTSMASPHVTGAVAVLQQATRRRKGKSKGRLLAPATIKQQLMASAAPMPKNDLMWDWPCGTPVLFIGCGEERFEDMTGAPYKSWQVGAGALDLGAALGL